MKSSNFPWVFWITVSVRKKWFSYFWKTRGANFLGIQLWIFKISIGMPWLKTALDSKQRAYGDLETAKETNTSFLSAGRGVLIGKYK